MHACLPPGTLGLFTQVARAFQMSSQYYAIAVAIASSRRALSLYRDSAWMISNCQRTLTILARLSELRCNSKRHCCMYLMPARALKSRNRARDGASLSSNFIHAGQSMWARVTCILATLIMANVSSAPTRRYCHGGMCNIRGPFGLSWVWEKTSRVAFTAFVLR